MVRTEQQPLKDSGFEDVYICLAQKKYTDGILKPRVFLTVVETNALWGTQVELFQVIPIFSTY